MSDVKDVEGVLLHPPAMEKIAGGTHASLGKLFLSMAQSAKDSNAAIYSATIGFVEDEEAVNAEFVPEITITVRKPRS